MNVTNTEKCIIAILSFVMAQRTLFHFGVGTPDNNKRKRSDESECTESPAKKTKSTVESDGKSATKQRKFNEKWLREFPWLEYDSANKRMHCTYCRAARNSSNFAKDGAGNLQHSTVTKHNATKEHKDADEAHQMRKQLYNVDDSVTVSDNEKCKVSESDKHLFRTVYFAAKDNQPNAAVNKLLELLRISGVPVNYHGLHSDTIQDIQSSLLYVLDEIMKDELKEAKYYGLILDESTDLSVHKKLVVYIRYVCPSDKSVKSELVGDIRIPDGTAATLVFEVKKLLRTLGLDSVNLVGLGSDGASVMFGRKGGVGVKLQQDSPMMTHVHCIAHRLSLACSDVSKSIPYLQTYKTILKNLYIHVNGSGIRTHKLEEMQKVMEEPNLKLKDPINIRWLAMEDAVKTIHKCYGSIVMYLQSNEGKNTIGDVIADGLLKEVLHYKFPAFTAVLADALKILAVLSKQLQAEDLDLSQFTPMKESAVGKLNGLKNVSGTCMKEFESQIDTHGNKVYYKGIQLTHANEKSTVEKLKHTYIDSVTECIEERLTTNSPILEAFSVLEPSTHDLLSSKETDDHLKCLAMKYNIDLNELKLEYAGVKYLLQGSYSKKSFMDFCKIMLKRHSSEYPRISKLCNMSQCIPVSSVACERGFSLQNRIKVKARTSLSPDNLETLMRLSCGPDVDKFPYEKAIVHWHKVKKRRLQRLYAPSNV